VTERPEAHIITKKIAKSQAENPWAQICQGMSIRVRAGVAMRKEVFTQLNFPFQRGLCCHLLSLSFIALLRLLPEVLGALGGPQPDILDR
jgi:hypothetical protein